MIDEPALGCREGIADLFDPEDLVRDAFADLQALRNDRVVTGSLADGSGAVTASGVVSPRAW